MERMDGTPISHGSTACVEQGIDIKRLARAGVEIFFTQVFRDGFFHADMHPGNIFVAIGHGEPAASTSRSTSASWARCPSRQELSRAELPARSSAATIAASPPPTSNPAGCRRTRGSTSWRAEIRAVCEPIFDRPLKEISLAAVLVQLFKASRRFNVEIQPQLVLLQKTLLNVEGLGRELDPDLDLWVTAKPFLERWMREQIGWRAVERRLRDEAPFLATGAASVAAADLPAPQQSAGGIGDGDTGIRRCTTRAQPLAGADRASGRGGGCDPALARLVADAADAGRSAAVRASTKTRVAAAPHATPLYLARPCRQAVSAGRRCGAAATLYAIARRTAGLAQRLMLRLGAALPSRPGAACRRPRIRPAS